MTTFNNLIKDAVYYVSGCFIFQKNSTNYFNLVKFYLFKLNNFRKYILKKYVYTINHKKIAINYFYFSLWSGLSGAALATMIRLELAYPGSPFFKGDSLRYLQVITAHGLIMVFFVVVPILFGGFANFLIPYHVGSKDVAFPRLNSIGFWILPCGFLLVSKVAFMRTQYWKYYDKPLFYFNTLKKKKNSNIIDPILTNYGISGGGDILNFSEKLKFNFDLKTINLTDTLPIKSFLYDNIFHYSESFWYMAEHVSKQRRKKIFFSKCSNPTLTASGWAFITPLSSNTNYTNIGAQDILIVSVIFAGVSTTISFTNLLITRRTLAMPGLRNRRVLLPFITISLLLTMRMLAIITPVLGASMFMLLMDRHWKTTFFEFSYGGDTVLFQHLFWFFGHPEVYVLIIPTFGFINMILPYNNTRRTASKHHLIWATYIMAYMGFIVWGHHMYLVGLDHRSRSLYSTVTIMISLPATIKLVNWTLTLLNGALKYELSVLWAFAYLFVFIVGGFTGMWLSHVGLNISMHDTFYVIAHFHLMLSGSTVVGIFAGFYYYFVSFFGIKCSKIFGYLHLIYYVGGQWMTFLPMFWLGFSGLPRRVHDYPLVFIGWNSMISSGHFITMLGVFFFFIMLVDSHIEKKLPNTSNLGIPRWHKRILYYLYKISYLRSLKNELNPTQQLNKIKLECEENYFYEFEKYEHKGK